MKITVAEQMRRAVKGGCLWLDITQNAALTEAKRANREVATKVFHAVPNGGGKTVALTRVEFLQ